MIGLDNAASLSCELYLLLKLYFASLAGSGSFFCFPFGPFPLFFFEIKFPAFEAMLCKAVVQAVMVVAWVVPLEDLPPVIDSEPPSNPMPVTSC